MDTIHNVVFYWVGGTEAGSWHAAAPMGRDVSLRRFAISIRRQGYYTVFGNRAVGAPEGPPKALPAFNRVIARIHPSDSALMSV